ncbi:C6 finger domain-containing protein [Pleurostoma richardsiae]|uniref:C6 finger domain-containing protein n=1 Tax=Pleurostoma richardsiae TaxID=41990 RepID=A0AA38R8K1_9PEZI|nr:C6 finger domain-containing protein [Pleurostoma richardsiae]
MSDYYQQFLSSMSGVAANPNQNAQDAHPSTQPPPSLPFANAPIPNPYQSLGYFTGFPEPIMFSGPKSQKSRRKSAPGMEHIKHRRTRSGCYTCRSRRVKCDENHPICDRCRKGKRECVYPEPAGSKSSSTSKDGATNSQHASPESSHDEEDETERDLKLDTIPDEEEPEEEPTSQTTFRAPSLLRRASTTSSLNLKRLGTRTRQSSETPSLEGTKSSSPSASTGTANSLTPATHQFPEQTMQIPGAQPDWAHLPPDLRFYLEYYTENISHFHYSMVHDTDDFFRMILPNLALQHQPLLYAVVGFAAYHCTLTNPNGKIHEFLQYYNKSVTLLLSSLKRKEKHNLATLMTILQLATIEEYLGDWVNLMGHQRAAFEILTNLFTPESVMQTPLNRIILTWYVRFDVFVGLMGGFQTALPREWFTTFVQYCQTQVANDPDNISWKIEDFAGRLRLISRDMSLLFAGMAMGEMPGDRFLLEHGQLSRQLSEWKEELDRVLGDPGYLVTDFSYQREPDPEDFVNPYAPGTLYDYPLFATTVLGCEWHSIVIMHESQVIRMARTDISADLSRLTGLAYAICQIFETVEFWPAKPKGVLITLHPCIAIATLFLPRDAKHHMWMRRKFALLELSGLIFPQTMRTRMAELFRDQSCLRWWLPNDEGFSRTLQSIRAFADERNATTAVSAETENLREIKHIFAAMQLDVGSDASPVEAEGSASAWMDKGKDFVG